MSHTPTTVRRCLQLPSLLALAVGAGCVFQTLEEASETIGASEAGHGETTGLDAASAEGLATTATAEPTCGSTSDADRDRGAEDDEGTAANPPSMGACCRPNGTPGCEDLPDAESCVCALDSHCCNIAWDSFCVELGVLSGCMDCGEQSVPVGPGDCCGPTLRPGCTDPEVEACVCDFDSFCCEVRWDEVCADQVVTFGCGCGFGPFTGDGGSGSDDGSVSSDDGDSGGEDLPGACCEATAAMGCLDLEIEACVCASDPYCCDFAWDNHCVAAIAEYECGGCTYALGEGDCCEASDDLGCNDQAVQDCVCASDPQCCTERWDDVCAAAVEAFGCGTCRPIDMTGTSTDPNDTAAGTSSGTGT